MAKPKNQKAKARAQAQRQRARSNQAEAQARARAKAAKPKTKPQGKATPGAAGLPAKAIAKPPVFVPGTPGIENQPVPPFWQSDDLAELGDRNFDWDQQLADIQSGLERLIFQTDYDKSQIDKSRVQELAATSDEMASRGLMQSSIRDADLYDIESTARLRKEFIDTQIKTAQMESERQRGLIQSNRDAFAEAYNKRGVENAQGVNADMPRYAQEPTAGHFEPVYTSPQTAPKMPQVISSGPQAQSRPGIRPNIEQGAGSLKAEAKSRMGGKKGGRGSRPKVGKVVGAGSAGIR